MTCFAQTAFLEDKFQKKFFLIFDAVALKF